MSNNTFKTFIAALFSVLVTAGCTTASVLPSIPAESAAQTQTIGDTLIPVVRYGRYTLVELMPEAAQRDLLLQVVNLSIPAVTSATVGEAMRSALTHSGYRLCDDAQVEMLYALPLPAAHFNLGPLTLREALRTLAGPAWDLRTDDGERRICFATPGSAVAASHPKSMPAPSDLLDRVKLSSRAEAP
ncbi:MAG: PilL N-terminal domain-containing protein [Nitrospiraceae bacterium]